MSDSTTKQGSSVLIRPAADQDFDGINDIYNYYVRSSHATFETNEWVIEQRAAWFKDYEQQQNLYKVFVATIEGEVVGFAYNAKYKEKPAYRTSSEVTVYLKHGIAPRGIGSALYEALFSALENAELHRFYAIVAMPNAASIRLHEKFGFKLVGELDEVGYKYGKYHATAILEKRKN